MSNQVITKNYFLLGLTHVLSPYYVWEDPIVLDRQNYYSLRHYLTYAKATLYCSEFIGAIRNIEPYMKDGVLDKERLKVLMDLNAQVNARMSSAQIKAWEASRRVFASEFFSEAVCRTPFYEALYKTEVKTLIFATDGIDPVWGVLASFDEIKKKLAGPEEDFNLSVESGGHFLNEVLEITRKRLYKQHGMGMQQVHP